MERAKLEAARAALQKLRRLQREMATDTSHLSASAIGALYEATARASEASRRSVWNNAEDAFRRYGWAALPVQQKKLPLSFAHNVIT